MRTIEIFLQELLLSQKLTPEQERMLQAHKKEVTDFLRAEFGNAPIIKYAGSREKGTMNQDNYDLDIVCYFPSNDTRSLREIRDDVSEHLSKKYSLKHKASAERITSLKGVNDSSGYHIDVVPGRFIEGTDDVFLNVAYGDKERMQTNLKTHINYITKSGCVPIIRLIKIWCFRNNVRIKTFILELFVVKVLNGFQNKNDLKSSFLKIIESLKDKFGNVELEDPANTNNIVSRTIESADKAIVVSIANETFNKLHNSIDLNDWEMIFKENKYENRNQSMGPLIKTAPASVGFTPRAPWCN